MEKDASSFPRERRQYDRVSEQGGLFTSRLKRWGHSLALRVPNHIVKQMGLQEEDYVEIELHPYRTLRMNFTIAYDELKEIAAEIAPLLPEYDVNEILPLLKTGLFASVFKKQYLDPAQSELRRSRGKDELARARQMLIRLSELGYRRDMNFNFDYNPLIKEMLEQIDAEILEQEEEQNRPREAIAEPRKKP